MEGGSIGTKTYHVPLVGGGVALVDMADATLVSQYTWRPGGTGGRYAVALISDRAKKTVATVYLHRLVMAAGGGDIIDHIDGNTLNCRRANLRFVDGSENAANIQRTRNSTGYRGVVFHPKRCRWQARIERNGRYRGPFRTTAEAAAQDADALLRGLYGDIVAFNFPNPGERGIETRQS